MSKIAQVQALLNTWCAEYEGIIPEEGFHVRFIGYETLHEKGENPVLGLCTSYPEFSHIRLGLRFRNRKLGWLETSVLWHEFAHAVAYHEDGKGNDHDSRWREIRDSRPLYKWGDRIADFVYVFLPVPKDPQ